MNSEVSTLSGMDISRKESLNLEVSGPFVVLGYECFFDVSFESPVLLDMIEVKLADGFLMQSLQLKCHY